MPKVAQLPTSNGAPHENGAETRHAPRFQHRFYAFLSYSHKDEDLAEWLHRELEGFRVPRALAGRLTENGVVPKRLTPIFRDEQELAAADDLGDEIETALASSQFLIVLCSPNAAKSRWTNSSRPTPSMPATSLRKPERRSSPPSRRSAARGSARLLVRRPRPSKR